MAANMCYMIVTPDVEDCAGIAAIPPGVLNPPRQYMVKFGDGDPNVPGRYQTHNPSYTVNVNRTGQNAKTFQQRVFANRGFAQAPRALEWYIVWERTPGVPGHMRLQLLQLLTDWLTVDTTNAAQVTTFVNKVIAVIPDICRTPN
ncbi:hypothetical protein H0H81_010216 [Sphagnurus paluster]|uniref:Uncharacterized protein n=1 Tax=Sphagnurus paluster TaxID=117069 RepID=A0A9P7FRM6_9AGAR|nr:hypothetical protein H0H81_010216 [Sphagnurus paluster]